MFKRIENRIKNFDLRKYINKTFKICFHKFEWKKNSNQFGKFEFQECETCGKTQNTSIGKTKIPTNPKVTMESPSQEFRNNRLDKILNK